MLAAVVLGAAWTWSLAGLSVACYVEPLPAPGARRRPRTSHGEGALSLHLWGMLVAFVVAALLTAYFVVRLSAAIERRDAEIAAMREQATRTERLAALTTLAAGAAHELATPLGTIAIAATELERALARQDAGAAALRDDARLIRAEVERCRRILDQMASDAGETAGEAPVDGRRRPPRARRPRRAARRRRGARARGRAAARGDRGAAAPGGGRRDLEPGAQRARRDAAGRAGARSRWKPTSDALRVTVRDERPRHDRGRGPGARRRAVLLHQAAGRRAWDSGCSSRARWRRGWAGVSRIHSSPGAGATARLELPRGALATGGAGRVG